MKTKFKEIKMTEEEYGQKMHQLMQDVHEGKAKYSAVLELMRHQPSEGL
jgi:hypothetical protein